MEYHSLNSSKNLYYFECCNDYTIVTAVIGHTGKGETLINPV
jgi:hypothetical protein